MVVHPSQIEAHPLCFAANMSCSQVTAQAEIKFGMWCAMSANSITGPALFFFLTPYIQADV